MQISVLYIHHCGVFGGASKSLLNMIKGFSKGAVRAYIITPNGSAATKFEEAGIPTIRARGISAWGLGKVNRPYGLNYLLIFREIYFSISTLKAILKAKKKWPDINLVHINEFPLNLVTIFCKIIFTNKPLIVHARSQQIEKTKAKLYFSIISFIHKRCTDVIIAIDKAVKVTLPEDLKTKTIYNGVLLSDLKSKMNEKVFYRWAKIKKDEIVVGLVANFIIHKGIYEFVEAANICIKKGLKIHFVLVGDNTRNLRGMKGLILKKLNLIQDIKSDVKLLVNKYCINRYFHMTGFVYDTQNIYKKLDILCFPAHGGSVGRPVFEAAFFKVPSIIAANGDIVSDIIEDGITGICIPPKDAKSLADSIEYLYKNPSKRKKMGEEAYKLAMKNFDAKKNAKTVLEIYKNLINK